MICMRGMISCSEDVLSAMITFEVYVLSTDRISEVCFRAFAVKPAMESGNLFTIQAWTAET